MFLTEYESWLYCYVAHTGLKLKILLSFFQKLRFHVHHQAQSTCFQLALEPQTSVSHVSPWHPQDVTERDVRCFKRYVGCPNPKLCFSSPKLKSSQWLSEARAKPLCTCLGVLSRNVCQLLKSAAKEERGTWRLSPLFNPYICYLLLPKGLNCLNTSISRWKSGCMQGQPDIVQVGRTEMKSSSSKKDGARTQWGQFSERSRGAEKIRSFFCPYVCTGRRM